MESGEKRCIWQADDWPDWRCDLAKLDTVLFKSRFWQRWSAKPFNARQLKVLGRVLDGLDSRLTSSKWAPIAQCSPDTALRDITQLLEAGVLKKSAGGGRSTAYELS